MSNVRYTTHHVESLRSPAYASQLRDRDIPGLGWSWSFSGVSKNLYLIHSNLEPQTTIF